MININEDDDEEEEEDEEEEDFYINDIINLNIINNDENRD